MLLLVVEHTHYKSTANLLAQYCALAVLQYIVCRRYSLWDATANRELLLRSWRMRTACSAAVQLQHQQSQRCHQQLLPLVLLVLALVAAAAMRVCMCKWCV
jgi:hypothetical protein